MSPARPGAGVLVAGAALAAGAGGAMAARSALRHWEALPDPTDGRPLDLPPGEEVAVTARDGARLALHVSGPDAAPTVVLVHGWTGDRRVWGAVARRLVASGRRVAVYDQRGHGASGVGDDGLSIDAIGDDLAAVLDTLDASAAVVGGHSMGGMAVQSFALRHPRTVAARVAGLALVSTAAVAGAGTGVRAVVAESVVASRAAGKVMASPLLGPVLARRSVGGQPALSHLVATAESFAATAPVTRRGFLASMSAMDLRPGLAALEVPTVVVSGTDDSLLAHRLSEELASLIPGARLVAVTGAGHQLPFEAPDRLTDILLDTPAEPVNQPQAPHQEAQA